MIGPVYWHPLTYRAFMRCLYGSQFRKRYLQVVSQIEPGWTVLDICSGDCFLASFLQQENRYIGIDSNPMFVEWAKRKGVETEQIDVRTENLPEADCAVMLGSLYQFIPEEDWILKKVLKGVKRRLIVSEPVENLSQQSVWLSRLCAVMTNPGYSWANEKFSRESLISVFNSLECSRIIENGRDLIGVFDIP